MNCINPILIPNKFYGVVGSKHYMERQLKVACGKCCNCRANKRTWYETLAQYQLREFHGEGTFLTITYDDYHLPYVDSSRLTATLRSSDVKSLLRAFRRDLRANFVDLDSSSHRFTWLYVGEYGQHAEKTPLLEGRPHYHIMLFGISPQTCDYLVEKHWKKGKMWKSLPIQKGCARYVLKYLDKQVVFGKQAQAMYEDKGLERPRLRSSIGMAKPIIRDNFDYIMSHGGQFIGLSGKSDDIKMLPPYYKNKWLLSTSIEDDLMRRSEKLLSAHYQHISVPDEGRLYNGYSKREIEFFEREKAVAQHEKSVEELRKEFIPYDNTWEFDPDHISKPGVVSKLVKDAIDLFRFEKTK